jgi:hypothetical protein
MDHNKIAAAQSRMTDKIAGNLTGEEIAAAAFAQFGIVAEDAEVVAFALWLLEQSGHGKPVEAASTATAPLQPHETLSAHLSDRQVAKMNGYLVAAYAALSPVSTTDQRLTGRLCVHNVQRMLQGDTEPRSSDPASAYTARTGRYLSLEERMAERTRAGRRDTGIITEQSPILHIFAWLDRNQWACWLGLALCIFAVGYIEAHSEIGL